MKTSRSLSTFAIVLAASGIWAGCSSDAGDDAESAEEAATAGKPVCTVFSETLQRDLTKEEVSKLNDPVAKLILSGGTCPTSFQEIQAKLRKVDAKNCKDDPAAGPAGVSTRFVSNRSQLTGKADDYRAVITRACNGRQENELFMSLFGISAGDAELPGDLELIGQDKTKGVFDYYAREDNKWKFFGNSEDLVGDGYNCTADGACVPKAAAKTRCASCHVGGGLIMKELNSPWTNWADTGPTPGTDELFKKHVKLVGQETNGDELEGLVTGGNRDTWVPHRVEFLKGKGTAELLRPLFCTTDINLQAGNGSANQDFFLDPEWDFVQVNASTSVSPSVSISFDAATYAAQLATNGQFIADGNARSCNPLNPASCSPLKKGTKKLQDTVSGFMYPERSAIDALYVRQLVTAKIIDEDFVKDVLAIDFTRPIFSPTRCGLLQFAPTLTAAKMTPAGIRDGFKASLAGKPGAAAELLKSVSDTKDLKAHADAVKKFADACNARNTSDPKKLTADVLAVASHLRAAMRRTKANLSNNASSIQPGQGVIEFAETLPVDGLREDGLALDPVTCERTLK
ncbi:MAG TPA: hypothetical protein VLT33_49715 [Labilithrix sp.]|nr:hypothetical protein [Labilithrix sp.]